MNALPTTASVAPSVIANNVLTCDFHAFTRTESSLRSSARHPSPDSHLSQHHPGSTLASVPSAPSGRPSALPLATHTLRVSAGLLGPGNHSLGSGARCFWGQAGTKWQGRWVEDNGKLSYLKVSEICAAELRSREYRLRRSGFAHHPTHTLATSGCRQVTSEPLYPRVCENQGNHRTHCRGL